MFKRFLPVTLLTYFFITTIIWGCTKLDTTTLGSDLIPAVDNVKTFDTTLDIITTQQFFDDSFKILKSENNVLGYISNDPLFGQTEANIFLQPKPGFYPFYFGAALVDSLVVVDSVVLCLSFKGAWGDTTKLIDLKVKEITDITFGDSVFQFKKINFQPTLGPELGSRTVDIRRLPDNIKIANGKDSVTNQIRIKLSDTYAADLFKRDTVASPSVNGNAFRSDSLYRQFYKGFGVIAGGATANALMYISLTDAKTRLEVHFKKKNITTGKLDTVYNSFGINTIQFGTLLPSASSNYIKRTYLGAISNPLPSELYLQTGPGTFANLDIPGLAGLNNRIVHKAEIKIEQIPDLTSQYDSIFSIPPFLYVDLLDTGFMKWKPLYFDLSPNTRYDPDDKTGFLYFPNTGTIDYNYFGGAARKKTNAVGESVYYYDLNITRYVQQMVTKGAPNYKMRLFPGFRLIYPQYPTTYFPNNGLSLDNPLAFGRIRIKSGNHPDPKVKMRLRIIYSKI